MAAKKKVAKPNVTIKKGENKPDIDLKVRNLGKAIKESEKKSCKQYKYGGSCMLFGSTLAMILSFERSASILWAIFHGALSWFYVLFRAMQIWGWF